MQIQAVAPARFTPASPAPSSKSGELPAIPFEEALARVQAKGQPRGNGASQPPAAEGEAPAESLAAEEADVPEDVAELPEEQDEAVVVAREDREAEAPEDTDAEHAMPLLMATVAETPTNRSSMPNPPVMDDAPDAEEPEPDGPLMDLAERAMRRSETDSRPREMATPSAGRELQATPIPEGLETTPDVEPTAPPTAITAHTAITAQETPESAMQVAKVESAPPAEASPTTPSTSAVLTAAPAPAPAADVRPAAPAAPAAPPPMPQEAEFAETNHPSMVQAIRANALPDGGRMQIRLDPPQLGSMEIHVEVREGVLTASFQTSSDEATRLLSHTLARLKHALESQGISVDRLQVRQAPREEGASAGDQDPSQRQQPQEQAGQQEQQRREMLRRLWRRVAGERDPLDLWA